MEFYEKMISRARGWSLTVAIMFGIVAILSLFNYTDPSSVFTVFFYGAISIILFLYWSNLGKARNNEDISYLEKAAQMQSVYLILMGVMSALMIFMVVLAITIPVIMS